ncbi:hypothetical protein FPOA_00136 [Fusarium poae]|uniref:Uncharacterized protein n=1 Tax=Fusarium poae TaxID=36050 RepID=A0A1B8B0C2_FUSPO|nr:hypothetical protein FPOA_00136 [Fusarium poae]
MASAQEAEEIIQSLSGHSTLLGKHVEKSAKRLLYELLRYANDKTFTRAKAEDNTPFITFKLYPDRIVSDCNSDALTKEDLRAICQPANKEKTNKANFKTIVAATKRTHIQSGNFSFEFQHNTSDHDNSDIMRPTWVTPAQTVPDNVTRITLYLHDQGRKDEIQGLREIIISQFQRLGPESILFLKNILSIKVESRQLVDIPRSRHFEKETIDEYRVSVKVTTVERKHSEEDIHTELFHVTERSEPSTGLAANLTLAFPLTTDFEVKIKLGPLEIFNIVPLDECRTKFHIHADIDIDNDDDDTDDDDDVTYYKNSYIMPRFSRNLNLQYEVADLFIKSILQFCEHPTLRYGWPRFLTGMYSNCTFLHIFIGDWISQNPVFLSRHTKQWRLLHHLASPGPDAQDDAGNPLLDDEINDLFLSSKYPPEVTQILRDYGLADLSNAQCLDLLKAHLTHSNLRWHKKSWTKEWHTALAKLISKLLDDDECSEKVKSLRILQLQDGSLVSAVSQPVYFPSTETFLIPETLDLAFIRESRSHGRYPKALYQRLGVMEASIVQVRELIFGTFSKELSLDDIKSYLHYLYLTHHSSKTMDEQQYSAVRVMNMDKKMMKPRDNIIYLPGTEHPYTPQSLLGMGMFGLSHPIDYLHPSLLANAPKHPEVFHIPWKKWLCDCLGMKDRLSLISDQPSEPGAGMTELLSESCKYVLKNRPDRFLGWIQHIWDFEGPQITENKALLSEIRELRADPLCGLGCYVSLGNTWVPHPKLKDTVARYMEYPEYFPFLKLGEDKYDGLAITTKWSFLTQHFGVRQNQDLLFFIAILQSIMHSRKKLTLSQVENVFELYSAIRTRALVCTNDEEWRPMIFFTDRGILYHDGKTLIWTGTQNCLWNAPKDMVSRHSLKRFYEENVLDRKKLQDISHLFPVLLSVRDATAGDLVEELRVLRDKGCNDTARIVNIYRYLDEEIKSSPEMRTAFGEKGVILLHDDHDDKDSIWLPVKECFWSESESTPIHCSLKKCYPGLKNFFVEKLGIRISSYDKLVYSTSTDVEEVKTTILSFMDQAEFLHKYPSKPMKAAKIFPVQRPTGEGQPPSPVELCSLDTEFAIGDREYLRKAMQSSIKMLSFDVTEVRRLQPLFKWLGIENRYLSVLVEERLNATSRYTYEELKLGSKAYHIARVAEAFNHYGSFKDAFSLYQKLRTAKFVKIDSILTYMVVVQDDERIKSKGSPKTLAHISSDFDGDITIYVDYNDNNKQLCLFSVLPRKIQQWLMQDKGRSCDFEVTNALTLIFASDVAILDEVLEDQGIVKVSFENLDNDEVTTNGGAYQSLVKAEEPVTLTIRER